MGIFPYIGLIKALYMVGTSNLVPEMTIDQCHPILLVQPHSHRFEDAMHYLARVLHAVADAQHAQKMGTSWTWWIP